MQKDSSTQARALSYTVNSLPPKAAASGCIIDVSVMVATMNEIDNRGFADNVIRLMRRELAELTEMMRCKLKRRSRTVRFGESAL